MIEVPKKTSPICCVFAYSSDSKPETEISRLSEVVDEANTTESKKVFVPLSGICIRDSSFTQCVKISDDPKPIPTFKTIEKDAAMKFMVFLVDQISILSRQRSKMLVFPYFLEQGNA